MSNFIIGQNALCCYCGVVHSALAKLLLKMTFYFVIAKVFKRMESIFLLTSYFHCAYSKLICA